MIFISAHTSSADGHSGWRGGFYLEFSLSWGCWFTSPFSRLNLIQNSPPCSRFLNRAASAAGRPLPITSQAYFMIQIIQALLLSPILNSLAVFGEEFGWRAYLQPKLLPLGTRKALLITGLIWGVWHWPVIAMGYEYGFNYWGAPLVGPLLFLVFTVSLAILFGWLVLRAGSIWPSVIAHGAINGIAALGLYAMTGKPNMLFGPAPNGLLGGLPLILLAVFLMLNRKALANYMSNRVFSVNKSPSVALTRSVNCALLRFPLGLNNPGHTCHQGQQQPTGNHTAKLPGRIRAHGVHQDEIVVIFIQSHSG